MQEVIVKVSQLAGLVAVVPIISTSAYVSGYTVGGIQTLTNIVSPRGAGILHSLTIMDKSNQKAPFDILLFDVSPIGSTTTDHAAFAWGGTDDQHLIGRIAVATGDYISVGSSPEAICQKASLDLSLQSSSGFDIYAVAVTSGTPTYTAGALRFVWGA